MNSNKVTFILHKPQLSENIGACARAIKNFNFQKLYLIEPKPIFPNDKILATSVGAKDIIKKSKVFTNLESSLGDIDILIGKVKESISPWLSIDSEITSSPWLINLIKEYEFCPSFNCGLCSSKTQKFINELLMRSQTSPLGLGPGERVIHQDYTSQLIKNTKIGNIIEDALKTINLSDLLDVPYWREVLNYLFSLDAKEGFLKFMSLLR